MSLEFAHYLIKLLKIISQYFHLQGYYYIYYLLGAGHCEDLSYIFETGRKGDPQDFVVRQNFIRMIANFVTKSDPNPTGSVLWKPNTEFTTEIHQLNINSSLEMIKNPFEKTMVFWVNLFQQKGQRPFSTF